MIFTNPRKPILTGIFTALVISSLILGGSYLYIHFSSIFPNYEFIEEFQLPESVKNAFGTYELESYTYTPQIIPTPIEPGLANVNLQGLGDEINAEIIEQLETYGFAIVDSGIEDIFGPMCFDGDLDTPLYISTDFCFHVLHSIFDNVLRIIEIEYFYNNFTILINALRNDQIGMYSIISDPGLKEAIKYNIAYLTVILYLLDNSTSIPSYVNSLVTEELDKIDQGVEAESSIFDYREDYSQYKPRGHYTRNEMFEHYFKAMMYAGRMGFNLDDKTTDNLLGIKQTKMALTLVYSLSVGIGNEIAWNYWDYICRTTNFLVGGSDDLTPADYLTVWDQEGGLNLTKLEDDNFIVIVIEKLKTLRDPKINSRFVEAFEGAEGAIKGFRLFGQSYTPDAYIFQELVYDNLPRAFPKALDIFSVLGSDRAEYHLESEKNYAGYEEKILELRNEFGNLTIADWTQNIYWQWLYSLLPLLEEKELGYPGYMQSDAWTDKSLITTLASWAELKHDTILYAKQPYSARGGAYPFFHYVEPYPQVYSRIAASLRMLKEGLKARGVLYENTSADSSFDSQIYSNFTMKFDLLAQSFDRLTEISIKELQNEELTDSDLSFISQVGKYFQLYVSYMYGSGQLQTETDKRTAIVADVFTETNTNQVLEVAVGNPFLIYVVVQDNTGELYLTRGVTFSYYEFHQPIGDRLTDEEWQEMLDLSPPPLPEWFTDNITIITISAIMQVKIQVIVITQIKKY